MYRGRLTDDTERHWKEHTCCTVMSDTCVDANRKTRTHIHRYRDGKTRTNMDRPVQTLRGVYKWTSQKIYRHTYTILTDGCLQEVHSHVDVQAHIRRCTLTHLDTQMFTTAWMHLFLYRYAMHMHTFIRTRGPRCVLRHMHTHKGMLRDTGPHAQALPAAKIVNTTGLCSALRLQLSASLSRLSSSQVLSCPTPASCLALALARSRDQSLLHPFICPLAFAQAPGSRMAIAPFSQMPTQPNFTPRSGGRPAGLVAARLGHHGGGGGREPGSCSGRKESSPSCRAGLPGKLQASSSPSHPPSAGLRLLTSEMRQ